MSILKPERIAELSKERTASIISRSMEDIAEVYEDVRKTIDDIAKRGDEVSVEHYRKYKDDITASDIVATREEFDAAYAALPDDVVEHLKFAAANIEKFHRAQVEREMWQIEVRKGIIAGRMVRPMDIVGAYVPGREASYPSSVLMTIIPARVAGVEKVVACTPPNKGMVANQATLVAADIAGADQVFKIGGPWAVGSMAYGTDTVPKVDKIVGPGNKYVTAAKMIVYGRVDIDSPAGPSEALILADETADPALITIDLLSQVEHDKDAAAVLVTTSAELAQTVCDLLDQELVDLPRKEFVVSALEKHSAVLVADDMDEAIDFTNEYATEHLEIVTADPIATLPRIKHAGSIFLGPYAPVPAGDYASGTNHVLPTGQCAKMFSGLSVDDFVKKPTFQYISKEGLESLRVPVTRLAEVENLPLHARTIEARFK